MGGSPSNSTTATYDNKTYNYQGGGLDLSNLLGTLNYKSSGSSFEYSQNKAFNPAVSNNNENSQKGGSGGEGGGLDLAASVGVGLGASGNAGAVDKTTTTGTGNNGNEEFFSNPAVLVGIGIATAFAISKFNKRK